VNNAGLLVFYLPHESGEKVTMGISAMLNMMVFLMNVASDVPSMPTYPYLSMLTIVMAGSHC
jgi:nicotinic acetylcholine receptor alpha-7